MAPRRSLTRVRLAVLRRIANARLKRILRSSGVPGAQSLFVGLSQTVPYFLANAWLALLENPSQLVRLRAEPHLMPRAIEELLRYCGTVHTLLRKANQTVDVAGVKIARGQSVLLKVSSANRDPEQFPDPNALDIGRRGTGHLGLGGGPHSCIGALLVRMAAISAIRVFADRLDGAELIDPVVWRRGSVHSSPHSLRVRFQDKNIAAT
jgi:cytochrome P450